MFYIIITPIITVTLNKIMYASENQMIVEDALTRIDSILEKKPLTEAAGKADPKDMSITFENVSFRYEDAAKMHYITSILRSERANMSHLSGRPVVESRHLQA